MKKTTLIFFVAAVIVLGLVIDQEYISYADFNLENPSWNGLSTISSTIKPLYAISSLSEASSSDTLLLVGPQRNFTADESGMIAAFLNRGGKVVVMDNFGKANSLLEALGSPILLDQVPLCDNDHYYINRSFPILGNIKQSRETANVKQLITNHPVSLNLSSGATPLALTSGSGFLDPNEDTRLDGKERMGSYCVAAKADYGRGELLVIGDPNLVINSMITMGSNRNFASNILTGAVLVDVSHGSDVTPLGSINYTLKYDLGAQMAIVLLALAACLAYVKRDRISAWIRSFIVRAR